MDTQNVHKRITHLNRKSGLMSGSVMSLLLCCLLALSTTDCSTAPKRSEPVISIPEAAVVLDKTRGPTWTEYNAVVGHARSLRDELEREQGRRQNAEEAARLERCHKKKAERAERCLYNRVQELESSWMPGMILPGSACSIPEPDCGGK